jgi:hypothetical protein
VLEAAVAGTAPAFAAVSTALAVLLESAVAWSFVGGGSVRAGGSGILAMRSMRSMRGGFIFRNRGPSLALVMPGTLDVLLQSAARCFLACLVLSAASVSLLVVSRFFACLSAVSVWTGRAEVRILLRGR